MIKIKFSDLKENKTNCFLIPLYTVIFCIVYGSWVGLSKHNIPYRSFFVTIVVLAIVIFGGICFYLSNLKVAKNRIEKENLNKEKE